MRRLEGKTAMITGCNRGIGKAILELFAKEGADIIACTRKETEEQLQAYKEIESNHNVCIYPYYFDLTKEDEIKGALKCISSNHKKIDCLVNNAGIPAGGLMIMTSQKVIREVFQINYFAQVQITQFVVKNMMKLQSGSIIFMSSVMGLDAMPGGTAYGASKSAIAMLVKTLSKETGTFGIRVNGIAPNLIDTEMAHKMEGKSYNDMIQRSSLKRIGKASEVAQTALFLASDESSYITGQIIRVDGGL